MGFIESKSNRFMDQIKPTNPTSVFVEVVPTYVHRETSMTITTNDAMATL